MTSAPSMHAAAQQTAKLTNGVVDYLIVNGAYISNATGAMSPSSFIGKEDLFIQEFESCMTTNVTGVLFAINAFLPLVQKSTIKKVVTISSGYADEDVVKTGEISEALPYTLSKVAVNMLNLKFAVEYKGEGITFLALSPGVVLTAFASWEESMLLTLPLDQCCCDE
jgi:NAD(P)-dependent dehydrogenase (short-subunit alcohol dehydrogenase family)